MNEIFISYSHKDKEWVVNWLLPKLEGAGLQVCIDFRDFKIGQPSLVNMEKAVKECQKTFLILTSNWLESEWTNFESLMLQTKDPIGKKEHIIPLLLEQCELPDRLSMFTCADFTKEKNWEKELSRLLKQLGISDSSKKTGKGKGPELISISKLPTTGKDLFGREERLKELYEFWADENTHIVILVGWGGVGKTALVNHWLT